MRILAALRARTMAGTASTPSVATPWRSSWRRRAAAGDRGSSKGRGFSRGGGGGGGGWVLRGGVVRSCGSGGLARRQISAQAAVSGDVLRGVQRVAFTD